jgi:diadenosine tetraphosphate (Ap4A) HIT family hydrolase
MLRPRLVLQSIKHATSFSELTEEDYLLLGEAIKEVERAAKTNPNVEKIYLESYNETGGHIHIHLTPRMVGETKVGPSMEDKIIQGFTSDNIMDILRNFKA